MRVVEVTEEASGQNSSIVSGEFSVQVIYGGGRLLPQIERFRYQVYVAEQGKNLPSATNERAASASQAG